ncbi:MAG: L-threonylcarbamoyladenylate synthase [Patescibacteria group bacterium]|jgi:L-threonylcarbamoyladenylate synthase
MFLTQDIDDAISVLQSGGIVVYPTETSYGIGCDATNATAVLKVFSIKHRAEGKGVTVLLPSNDAFGESFVTWNDALRLIAEKFWPGPLNIILSMQPSSSSIAEQCCTNGTIAVRRSSHEIANKLVDALEVPLVSTSANISGEKELYSAQEIFDRFAKESEQPDCILDAGTIETNLPSTLVAWDEETKKVVVLRQGAITIA